MKHSISLLYRALIGLIVGLSGQCLIAQDTSDSLSQESVHVDTTFSTIDIAYGNRPTQALQSAIVSLEEPAFNQGLISDPMQCIQGKIAGVQVYNRGGDPNNPSLIRIRGSALGSNPNPLIVIDGIVGAALETVDPNDIDRITVLKDATATAIYGLRAASGVVLVQTKQANSQREGLQVTYHGQIASSEVEGEVPVMEATQFLEVGGVDLGASTNWVNEITRTGFSQVHGISLANYVDHTDLRLSANYRNVEGILRHSGFEQFNGRLNLRTLSFNNRLELKAHAALTYRQSNFSFPEAFHYATTYNPTAPILGEDAPFPFDSERYGGYFENVGLFSSFNPVSLLEQNRQEGRNSTYLLGVDGRYRISNKWAANIRLGHQASEAKRRTFHPVTSLFRGNAASPIQRGRVDYLQANTDFNLYEAFISYVHKSNKTNLQLLAGFMHQNISESGNTTTLGDFTNTDHDFLDSFNPPGNNGGATVLGFTGTMRPDESLNEFFTRGILEWKAGLTLQASLRMGKSSFFEGESWSVFPAISLGIDLNKYLKLTNIDQLRLRAGWGLVGQQPGESVAALGIRRIIAGEGGSLTPTELISMDNTEVVPETQSEFNAGLTFSQKRFYFILDVYHRILREVIILREVDPIFGVPPRYGNGGEVRTQGAEFSVGYTLLYKDKFSWRSNFVASTYEATLTNYFLPIEFRANLGAPGLNGTSVIRLTEGEPVGQIWGPVFIGTNEQGELLFADLNNDGQVIASSGQAGDLNADFQMLGQGLPNWELGWGNQFNVGSWSLNAFFRAALGHSLVNVNRVFYEPIVPSQSAYNYIITELRDPNLTVSRFGSNYIEEADFLMLDNLTLAKRFQLGKGGQRMTLSLTGQNLWTWTNYTGASPEPALVDYQAVDGGNSTLLDYTIYDAASPGIDRRHSYRPARTVVFGVRLEL